MSGLCREWSLGLNKLLFIGIIQALVFEKFLFNC